MNQFLFVALGALAWLGCVPELEDRAFLVDRQRILAVRADLAEEAPGKDIRLEALVLGPDGPIAGRISFSLCTQSRRAEESNGISQECMEGRSLVPVGDPAEIPRDACAQFGPNSPPTKGDEPPRRPSDPDASGGYYMPILAELDNSDPSQDPVRAFGFQRIRCDLAGATRAVFDAYQESYQNNRHPQIAEVVLVADGQRRELLGGQARVAPSAKVQLEAGVAASSFEVFPIYSAVESRLYSARENMRASFYFTAGELGETRELMVEDLPEASASWVAPSERQDVHFAIVVRDSRGGVTWETGVIHVE